MKNRIALSIILLLCTACGILAQSMDPGPMEKIHGVRGPVRSYLEITAKGLPVSSGFSTPGAADIAGALLLTVSYCRIDSECGLMTKKDFTVPADAHEREILDRDGLDGLLRRLDETQQVELFLFYTRPGCGYPEIIFPVGQDGDPEEYAFVTEMEEGVFLVESYKLETAPETTTTYNFEDGRLLSVKEENDWGIALQEEFRYDKEGTLTSSRSVHGEGIITIYRTWDRLGRPVKESVDNYAPYRKTGQLYSYKYIYRGGESNYTSRVKMSRGRHDNYVEMESRVEGDRTVWIKTVTASDPVKKPGSRKRKHYTNFVTTEHSLTYNENGDNIEVVDLTGGGVSTEMSYLYDRQGNWIWRTTATRIEDSEDISWTLRAYRYEER
ncbi:MAG: hypothetical protein LUE10_05915 [Alistipes sp.]|nr:hypothetical protein [Alistipes sp.]